MQELLVLALHQASDGDAGPFGHDLRDGIRVDLVRHHRGLLGTGFLGIAFLLLGGGDFLLDVRNLAIADFRGLRQVAVAFATFGFHLQLVELLAQVANLVVPAFLHIPAGVEAVELLGFVGELLVKVGEPFTRLLVQRVRLLLFGFLVLRVAQQIGAFHLEPVHLTLELIDFLRRGVEFHTQVCGRLIDQINGLIRQLTPGDVPVGQLGCGYECVIADGHLVVGLVLGCDAAQDRDGVLDARLTDEHLLEAAFERRILFDVLTVFVKRGGADQAQFTARKHRLEHVARVHRAFCSTGSDDGVDFVDEGDDLPVRILDLIEHGLEAFLEFAAILRSGDHGAQIKADEFLVAQRARYIPGNDALGETFDDGGFADARLTDQHRVVLGAAGQDLDDTADFLITADHRVELAFLRGGGQVGRILFERLVIAFRVRAGHVGATSNLRQRFAQGFRGHSVGFEDVRGLVRFACGDGDEQVFGGDEIIPELLHFLFGLDERRFELAAGLRLRGA